MKKGMRVVRTHAALSVCVLLAALAVTGGGVYAVLAKDAEPGRVSAPVSTAVVSKAATAPAAVASIAQRFFQDTAAANGLPTPETARADALAAPPPSASAEAGTDTVVSADTPAVTPMHLPSIAAGARDLARVFPRLNIPTRNTGLFDGLEDTVVGITTAAVNQGSKGSSGDGEKSRLAQKSPGPEPEVLVLNLSHDFDVAIHLLDSTVDPAYYDYIDINGFYVEDGVPSYFGENGMSDRGELLLVEHVLTTPGIDFSTNGGVSTTAAIGRWRALMGLLTPVAQPTRASRDELASLHRVIAA